MHASFKRLSAVTRPAHPMPNEQGVVLLSALLILACLSILGAMALTTTRYELRLSGNDKMIARLKTQAESTAAATVERLEHLPVTVLKDSDWHSPTRRPWFSRGIDDRFDTLSGEDKYNNLEAYINDTACWIDQSDSPVNCAVLTADTEEPASRAFQDRFPDCRFQVIDVEVARGSSLQTGNRFKTMHNLYVIGVSTQGNARRMVQFGYRKMY